ncbi:hypothetical protein IP88_16285, partial [alpha proteobacterium AAP81b]
AGAGWRRADVAASGDGGASYAIAATLPGGAVIGSAVTALPAGATAGWDAHGAVTVELLAEAMWLESASPAAVLAGANRALLGDEIVQFTRAEALGSRRFRLSGLLRGRRGSEAAVTGHAAGERFVLLDPADLVALDPGLERLGQTLLLRPEGAGDADAVAQAVLVTGAALRPLAPARLRLHHDGGDLVARWIRRSRAGFAWTDGIDAPLAEANEAYRVSIRLDGRLARRFDVTAPAARYTAADRLADGGGSVVTVAVAQLSAAVGPGAQAIASLA